MKTEYIKADLLVAGGGIAGLMAAIRAAELGAEVVVAEKGKTQFSGSARAGNDHFWAYIPEYHGPDMEFFIKECMLTQYGFLLAGLKPKVVRTWVENSHKMVNLWEKWGIPMKQDGEWVFQGHSFPGRMMTHLKYKGDNQKSVLTDQALKRGVKILNRVMVFDLLGDSDGVSGAVGIDTREEKFVTFISKSVMLGTGGTKRLWPNIPAAMMANNAGPFTCCGDGRSMAYRVGGVLLNPEMIIQHVGPKYYARAGQGSWMGVIRDPLGKPAGKYLTEPDPIYHDMIMEVDKQIFERYAQSGRGPLYMDCTGTSEEDMERMKKGMEHEGLIGLIEHLDEEGVDLRKNPIEFATYDIRGGGRIDANENSETSVAGLYSAGDEWSVGISGAAVFGWIGGEHSSIYAKESSAQDEDKVRAQAKEKKHFIEKIIKRKNGADWYEANVALNQVMADYAGPVRSEPLLKAGLAHIRRLKEKLHSTVFARDRWELTRCLEVVNLYDLGELVFVGALERKESRGLHQRVDYPYTDTLLNGKKLLIKNINGKQITGWRDVAA